MRHRGPAMSTRLMRPKLREAKAKSGSLAGLAIALKNAVVALGDHPADLESEARQLGERIQGTEAP